MGGSTAASQPSEPKPICSCRLERVVTHALSTYQKMGQGPKTGQRSSGAVPSHAVTKGRAIGLVTSFHMVGMPGAPCLAPVSNTAGVSQVTPTLVGYAGWFTYPAATWPAPPPEPQAGGTPFSKARLLSSSPADPSAALPEANRTASMACMGWRWGTKPDCMGTTGIVPRWTVVHRSRLPCLQSVTHEQNGRQFSMPSCALLSFGIVQGLFHPTLDARCVAGSPQFDGCITP